jgi:hypothetical protein
VGSGGNMEGSALGREEMEVNKGALRQRGLFGEVSPSFHLRRPGGQ